MSIRIYALSARLNIDAKEILNALKKLGIEGKGSSLASLTDEEIDLILPLLHEQWVKNVKKHEKH